MTLFLAIGNGLDARHLARTPVEFSSSLVTFYTTSTTFIVDYMKANIVKFVFGFEYSIVKDGEKVITIVFLQMALILLAFLHVSYGAAPLSRKSGLWIDIGQDNKMEEPPEGMGLKHTIETSGYRFFMADKVCWGAWKFHSHLTERMLFRVWQLQKSYSKSYLKVANASAFNRYAYELFG